MYTRQITGEQKNEIKQTSKVFRLTYDKKVKSKFITVVYFLNGINICLLLWVFASYIDIVSHNMTTCTYAWWNIIELFVKIF